MPVVTVKLHSPVPPEEYGDWWPAGIHLASFRLGWQTWFRRASSRVPALASIIWTLRDEEDLLFAELYDVLDVDVRQWCIEQGCHMDIGPDGANRESYRVGLHNPIHVAALLELEAAERLILVYAHSPYWWRGISDALDCRQRHHVERYALVDRIRGSCKAAIHYLQHPSLDVFSTRPVSLDGVPDVRVL